MPRVFLSYSHTDIDYVSHIAETLEVNGFEVWFDQHISTGDRWFSSIANAIQESDLFIVVMSPEAEKSEWVEKEILLAQRNQKPIYPLLLRGDVFGILITHQYTDVRDKKLPSQAFFEHLKNAEDVRRFTPVTKTRISLWNSYGRIFIVFAVLVVLASVVIWAATREKEAVPYQYTYELTEEFPANFWQIGSHFYELKLDCPGKAYDAQQVNTVEISQNTETLEGFVQFRLTGLMHDGENLSVNRIHPNQLTQAIITITLQNEQFDELYQQLNSPDAWWKDCKATFKWDEDNAVVLGRSLEASISIGN